MKIRPTLYIDLDNVVFNTIGTIKAMYDEDYRYYEDYEWIPAHKIQSYEFTELKYMTQKKLMEYFSSGRFFDRLECMEEAELSIMLLNKFGQFPVTFVSRGTAPNIKGKIEWVNTFNHLWGTNVSFEGIYIPNSKSLINMRGGVLIDDELANLQNNSANHTICFGDYTWNKEYKGERVTDWVTLRKILNEGRYDIETETKYSG